MTRKHTILRNMSAVTTAEPFGFGAAARSFAPPEIGLETEDLTPDARRDLARDPQVLGIAPVMSTKLIAPVQQAAAAAGADETWGIAAVGADRSEYNGEGVTVAVLDTGIDNSHPAFQGVTLVEEDFSGSGNGDVNGHGTHCAGTIFGRDVDGKRIGIARGVNRALIGKVLGDDGRGDSDMIFRAIQWAVDGNADVVSMSLGFDFPGLVDDLVGQEYPADLATSWALEAYRGNLRMFDALMEMTKARLAFHSGAVVVAAAGNESKRDRHPDWEISASLPAAADGVVSVGALARSADRYSVAVFSNTLPQISAPGVDILSAKTGGGLVSYNGTSMACPHVAGIAALWWHAIRNNSGVPARAPTVLAKLLATARPGVFAPNTDVADRGVGLVTAP